VDLAEGHGHREADVAEADYRYASNHQDFSVALCYDSHYPRA
jgi:hypothetical protein